MAKSKHSAALFEVMARTRGEERPARPGVIAGISSTLATLFHRRESDASEQAPAPRVEVAPEPVRIAPSAPSSPGRAAFLVDADRHEVSLRLSYTAAAVCVLALLTTVAAAYVAGRKADWAVAQRPLFTSSTSDQIRTAPPQPDVTAVRQGLPHGAGSGTAEIVQVEVPRPPLLPEPSNTVVVGRNRRADLNYVIIQSYPEEKLARSAQALLIQNGVDCTIERLKGYHASGTWYSVVGVHGFRFIRKNPELERYTQRVKEISEQFAKPGSFKAFEPAPYKWPAKG